MNVSKFFDILLNKSPKKINNTTEDILDFLFEINEVVRELNSIDFCNPLGYILTKTLPPEGEIDNTLKEFSATIKQFNNDIYSKLNSPNTQVLDSDIEELRQSLENLIPPESIIDIIPGGDTLTNLIQTLNDSLVLTNLSTVDKKLLLTSFSNRLIPLTNPHTIVEAVLFNQIDNLNKKLSNLIKPERFREDLLGLIKLVNRIHSSILYIENVVNTMNKIIKTVNSILKVLKISISILERNPIPAKFVTVGVIVAQASKSSEFEDTVNELSKLLTSISSFLEEVILERIITIREEIFILLIGLNQLYENLKSCEFFEDDILVLEVQAAITTLDSSLLIIESLFPSVKNNDSDSNYKGYTLNIVEEEVVDNPTTLSRRRIVITNENNIIEYEGNPTYSNNKQTLLKEGQYYVDKKGGIVTYDNGNNELTDLEVETLINQIGYRATSISEAVNQEEEVTLLLKNQIENNAEDKDLYDKLINNDDEKILKVRKIIKLIYSQNENPLIINNKIESIKQKLLKKGYSLYVIQEGIKSAFNQSNNIVIENNNITLT